VLWRAGLLRARDGRRLLSWSSFLLRLYGRWYRSNLRRNAPCQPHELEWLFIGCWKWGRQAGQCSAVRGSNANDLSATSLPSSRLCKSLDSSSGGTRRNIHRAASLHYIDCSAQEFAWFSVAQTTPDDYHGLVFDLSLKSILHNRS
jgi:hypothetical protein